VNTVERSFRLEGPSGLGARPRPSQFDTAVTDAARAMSETTSRPRRVRVCGRLDLMGVRGVGQGVIKIHVGSGAVVTALWQGKDPIDELRSLLNRNVVCEGMGVFHPSGTLLRIDADAVAEAQAYDAGFAVVPRAARAGDITRRLPLKAGEASAYGELLGSVPAEESDEDLLPPSRP
jgi:hypothetical protein